MKLRSLEIRGTLNWQLPEDTLEGDVTFKGDSGTIKLHLTQEDILEVEQLLRGKLKDLAGEL